MHSRTVGGRPLYPAANPADDSTSHGTRRNGAREARLSDLLRAVEQGDTWWGVLAACQDEDPELFFPGPGQRPTLAKRICEACLVRQHCYQFALATAGS